MARRKFDPKREDIAFALSLGWTFEGHTGGGHIKFSHPRARVHLIVPQSPSDYRGVKNAISWTRRNTPREDA